MQTRSSVIAFPVVGAPFQTRRGLSRTRWLLAGIGHPPDGIRAIVADHQRPVLRHCDADRSAPDLAFRGDEAGQKILVFAGRFRALHRHPDDFVAGAQSAIPGTMLAGRNAPALLLRY